MLCLYILLDPKNRNRSIYAAEDNDLLDKPF